MLRRGQFAAAGALALAMIFAACGSSVQPSGAAFPSTFTPAPALLDPPPPAPGKFGLHYLERVYSQLRTPWRQFLEDCRLRLPPEHPLNNAALVAQASMDLAVDGSVLAFHLDGSGQAEFDAAVAEIVHDVAPYPVPPAALLSDDEQLHLSWQFARDVRSVGVATASVTVVRWTAARAVPALLARGLFNEALERVAVMTPGPSQVALADDVVTALVLELMETGTAEVRLMALGALATRSRAENLARIQAFARAEPEPAIQLAAARALSQFANAQSIEIAGKVLAQADNSPVLAVDAASLLRSLDADGSSAHITRAVDSWLAGDEQQQVTSLSVLAIAPEVHRERALRKLLVASSAKVRAAACVALAKLPTLEQRSLAGLLAAASQENLAARLQCVAALGNVAGPSVVRALQSRLSDRDFAVRAAAVDALGKIGQLDGKRLRVLEASSPVMAAALANLWTRLDGDPEQLRRWCSDDDPRVRATAVRATVAAGLATPEILAAAMQDNTAQVRLASLAGLSSQQLAQLFDDPAVEVGQAALARSLALDATRLLPELLRRLQHATGAVERARLAQVWLTR